MTKTFAGRWLSRCVLALALMAGATTASKAQTYPTKPVSWIVPYAAGGGHDTFTRIMAEELGKRLGQPVVVENKPGGGGIVAAEFIANSAPDGYTLFTADIGPNAIAAGLYPTLNYDPVESFTLVNLSVLLNAVLIVPEAFQANDLQTFIAQAKAKPGEYSYASTGTGGFSHLAAELFLRAADVQMLHVAYRGGGPGVTAVASNEVQMMFTSIPSAKPLIDSGKLQALAILAEKRSATMLDVPTVAEAGLADFSASSWAGVAGPKGLPPEVVERLSSEINQILLDPAVIARLESLGFAAKGGSPADFEAFVASEIIKWREVIKAGNIKPQ